MVGDGTWLTLGEAHERLKSEPHPVPMSYQTLRRMVDRGELPTTRIGSRRDRRVTAKAVDELKERMWAEAHPPTNEPAPDRTGDGQGQD